MGKPTATYRKAARHSQAAISENAAALGNNTRG
jgi:hypothetical protein